MNGDYQPHTNDYNVSKRYDVQWQQAKEGSHAHVQREQRLLFRVPIEKVLCDVILDLKMFTRYLHYHLN